MAPGLVAELLICFAHGSRFNPNALLATRSTRLAPAMRDPCVIAAMAERMTDSIFVSGSIYNKCGVMLEGLHVHSAARTDLFTSPHPHRGDLIAAMDSLKARYDRSTVRLATEGQATRSYNSKRQQNSPAWTTQLSEVPVVY